MRPRMVRQHRRMVGWATLSTPYQNVTGGGFSTIIHATCAAGQGRGVELISEDDHPPKKRLDRRPRGQKS